MNSLLAREDAEKHAGTRSCFYCNKVFNNYRALGGHLRIHQEDKTSRTLSNLGCSSNAMDITRNPPAFLPNSQRNSSAGVNNLTPLIRAPPPCNPFRVICSNETNHASVTGFTGGNPGVAQTQLVMSPNYSYGCGSAATYHHSSLASGAFAPTGPHAAMSYAAFASSSSFVATGIPIDSSLYLGSNGVCQFNTDEFLISRDGLPPTRVDALLNVQGYNLGPPPSSSLDKVGQNDGRSFVTCEEGKRPYLADESGKPHVTNASEKPKVVPNAHVEPENLEKKELPLFVEVEDSVPAPAA